MSDQADSFVIESHRSFIGIGGYWLEVTWTAIAVAVALMLTGALFVTWFVRRKRRGQSPNDRP